MVKAKILKRPKSSPKNTLVKWHPEKDLLLDKKLIAKVLVESLLENDLEIVLLELF